MPDTQINPAWLDPAAYARFLNQSFPGQWSPATLAWYAARRFNGRDCDLLVRSEGGSLLAGVALCYRQITLGEGAPVDICILSAGATRPDLRGQGHYAALLQAALQRCREQRCVAAIGFVTQNNASGRGLLRLGARVVPSFYLFSPRRGAHNRRSGLAPRPLSERSPRARAEQLCAAASVGTHGARFHYASAADWQTQFLRRPHPVRLLSLGADVTAVVEEVGATDRLQLLLAPAHKFTRTLASLISASHSAGRRFFMYTLERQQALTAARLGLAVRPGFLVVQDTGHEPQRCAQLARTPWHVHSGDRL